MKEKSQLVRATHAYIAAALANLKNENPKTYAEAIAKLDIANGKISLVIARNETSWQCSAMIREGTGSLKTLEFLSFRELIKAEPAHPVQSEAFTQDMPFKARGETILSTDQFFAELEKAAGSFHWHFQADIRPGTERRSSPRLWICAAPRDKKDMRLDPVEALCYFITGKDENLKTAAERIGLSPTDAAALHEAAADRTWRGPTGKRKPDEYLTGLRSKILEAIGILRKPSAQSNNHDETSDTLNYNTHRGTDNRLAMKDPRE